MEIHNYLSKDRKTVNRLMQKLVASKNVRERANIFAAIKAELIAEAEAEESAFFANLHAMPTGMVKRKTA